MVTKLVNSKNSRGVTKSRAAVSNVPKIAKYRISSTYQGQKYPGMQTETDRLIDVSNLSLLTSKGQLSKVKIIFTDNKKLRFIKKDNTKVVKSNSLQKTETSVEKKKDVDHS